MWSILFKTNPVLAENVPKCFLKVMVIYKTQAEGFTKGIVSK